MSETSTIPFEGTVAAAPLQPETAPTGSNRTKLFALLGGAAILVLAAAAYFLVFAGDDASTDAVTPPTPKAAAPVPATAPSAAPVPVTPRRLSAKSFGHDPFRALIVESDTAAGGTTAGGTTGGTTGTGSSVDPTTTGGTTVPVGTTDPVNSPNTAPVTPTVTADHTFRVVGVSSDQTRITVRVDGKSYAGLKAGEVFATYFKVVVVGGQVNGFQFGDEKFSVFGTKKLYIAA
jgi:hypothetical protein